MTVTQALPVLPDAPRVAHSRLLLMLFGWWIWAWCLPALAVLVTLARRDLRYSQVPS